MNPDVEGKIQVKIYIYNYKNADKLIPNTDVVFVRVMVVTNIFVVEN